MLNQCSPLRVMSRVFVAAFFSLSATVLLAQEGSSTPQVSETPALETPTPEEAPALPGKVVYKSLDSAGNVTFTDSAPIGRPSEAIRVPAANLVPGSPGEEGESGSPKEKKKPVKYTIAITSPVDDTLFGQETEAVILEAQLEPGLQEGHTFQLYYDGKPVGDGGMSYTVTTMDRGTHTVEAKVFDKDKQLLKSSEKVRFHIRRISKLTPKDMKAEQATESANPNKPTAAPPPTIGVTPTSSGVDTTKAPPTTPAGVRTPKGSGGAKGF
ncbi:MAG TPA: hypothetical protein VLB90_03240 [Pseudomonadales bacterium]|nr:hypothetical protein [Pseudomonadales bacterium]